MLNTKLNPEDFRVSCPYQVRFRDCDQMGHVNNAVYSTYLEQARFCYLKEAGFDLNLLSNRISFMLVETHIRFLFGAQFPNEIMLYIRAVNIKKGRFSFDYLIYHPEKEKRIAVAHSVHVGIDLEKMKAVSLGEDFINKINALEGY